MIGKKACLVFLILFFVGLFPVYQLLLPVLTEAEREKLVLQDSAGAPAVKLIHSSIEPGETLIAVFEKHGLSVEDLFAMRQAAASVHRLREVRPGQPYRFKVDQNNCVNSFTYGIDDNTMLKIERDESGFVAQKCDIPYESRNLTLGGSIDDSLIAALGGSREDTALAISISDILAWDIDFNTDLRKGDRFKVIVEGLYLDGQFKRYGKISAIEFINDGEVHKAYIFEQNGRRDYFDGSGKSIKKAFLKAPLSFRRISSSFSQSRRHPILRLNRPHHGIDYVAPRGTPVSATADGRVSFAGFRGAYGRLVILVHRNGMQTYYGHLSGIARDVKAGRHIEQGDLVGSVGATGMATGPHLHYEMRQGGRPINPQHIRMTAGNSVSPANRSDFRLLTASIDQIFATASFPDARDARNMKYARSPAPAANISGL
ncbi:MAG: peptidoglycan DD-metalloendopeptidase family protein [Deltaproteobacteria bacterium]